MNTVYKFPASKLPAELRGDISSDAFVTVVVDDESNSLPGYTQMEIDALVSSSMKQKERGLGTRLSSRKDIDAHFDTLKAQVDAKHQTV